MFLDEILAGQKSGEAIGVASICSAHPYVLRRTMQVFKTSRVLVEATCNQVNQFGGYTGMTPQSFLDYVRGIAEEGHFPLENLILGGDHLGPNAWQGEPTKSAMQKSAEMVQAYVRAGFVKIHLDCSMRLADDPGEVPDLAVSASRVAQLAKIAEQARTPDGPAPRYVIGTEVPVAGGARGHAESVRVTDVENARQTMEATHEAFIKAGLSSAWERTLALVVQPGVEFGDDFVIPYDSQAATELSLFIEGQSMIYEAHSTDYQTAEALRNLVHDHFAILKVGPALTFKFREAVFALETIENELIPEDECSNVVRVLDDAMVQHPENWHAYYHGSPAERAFKRKYSLSDRARYYWALPKVQAALKRLMSNLGDRSLPFSLTSQFVPGRNLNAKQVIAEKIDCVLAEYRQACG